MITELKDLNEWVDVKEKIDRIEASHSLWKGNFVSHCVPPIYSAYCKIFHNIYEDASVSDYSVTWDELEKSNRKPSTNPLDKIMADVTWLYGGEYDPATSTRIRWEELAERYNLVFHPEINADSFTRNFPGHSWPRYLIGPEEGILHPDTCREIVRSIAISTSDLAGSQECFFHYDCFATNDAAAGDRLYRGKLIEVFETYNLTETYGSPVHWWAKDRSWFVCTDWDLTFTLFGGSDDIVNALISNNELECVRVKPTMRIDNKADQINP